MQSTMPSKERQTANAIVAAFNVMDVDTIISLRTPDCQRLIRPASLNYPPQSNDAYRANLNSMRGLFQNMRLSVDEVIEGTSLDAEGNERKKIVMYVKALGDTVVGEYVNEYVWTMGFDNSGEKINEWSEYVDVGMTRDFLPKLAAELRKQHVESQNPNEDQA